MSKTVSEQLSTPFSRRGFLKGVGAVGATAALASCGDAGKGPQSLFKDNPANVPVPPINGVVVAGSSPHNCGGRCVTKAYVENGVVKRLVTDERPDLNIIDGPGKDDPQRRACVRCRSQKGFMYRADRLQHPLKQTKNRGDVSGFVQISWDQAFTEIAQQLVALQSTAGAFYATYASGASGSYPGAQHGRLLSLLGGAMTHRQDYSWPGYEHVTPFIMGGGTPAGSSRQDCFNAQQIILWSLNHGETIWGTNSMWYTQQAKEMGIPVISIESRISQTAATVATQTVMVMPGTDAALILGMMYHLLKERFDLLDEAFIRKYVHGFFDDKSAALDAPYKTGTGEATFTSYPVPPGASLSAFVLGNDATLVTAGVNQATSIYPAAIGYNYAAPDPLAGKTSPIWGQDPKTPEWAEKICGVPAATIRSLAESIATKKTTCWFGSGLQRHYEQEQGIWLLSILGAITGNFGQSGCMFGFHTDRASAPGLSSQFSSVPNPYSNSYGYDSSKVTTGTKYGFSSTRSSFPVFLWTDVAKNGGKGQSDWNDPQVKKAPKMKAILNFGGNILMNQTGNCNYMRSVMTDRGNVPLVVVADHYMTASAAVADYVLPAATAWEKTSYTTTWNAGENTLFMGKAVDPMGEALDDFKIVEGIADKAGVKAKFNDGKDGWTSVQYVKEAFDKTTALNSKITWDQWTSLGIYSASNPNAPQVIAHQSFLQDPTKNPKSTPSGRFEAYCQVMVEDYEARGYANVDRSQTLLNGGLIPTKSTALADQGYGRYVYPIPMYIPLYEGRHANEDPATGIPHPDPTGVRAKGYVNLLNTFHIQYRSHSTFNSDAFLNELFKKDAKGQPAFLSPRTRTSLATWDDGVYEPIWINPVTAQQFGISHGDRVLVSNDRGRIYASANVTQRARANVLYLGQGAWHQLDGNGVDVGGCANTLTSARPSRIGQGMTLGNGTLVKIEKA